MLDPVSILIVTVLSGIISMAVLGSLRPARIPGVTCWLRANALAIAGLILFALQRTAPPYLSVVLANGIFSLAVLLMLQGCRQFFGKPRQQRFEYLLWGAMLFGIVFWTYQARDVDARIALASAFHAYVYASVGWAAWRGHTPGRPKYSYYFVTATAWLGAFGHLTRGVVYGCGFVSQPALLQPTPVNVAFLGLGILALPSLSIGMVMLAHDRMAERLERWANVDELTGALTRRAFLAQAEARLAHTAANAQRLSIAILDIDHFKSINDAYGHACGDQVLAHFGRLVGSNIRSTDLFGRLGGEEFAVLYPAAGRADAVTQLDRLRARVAASGCRISGERLLAYTFSAGVDEWRRGESLAHLMARADAALYAAKARGRNCVMAA
ncbi:MAG TPA: GGDEF domain-containing protein [Paraburkholderia sp.]|nr:GGDEF domain-containing protein [Paraburkholderia sp.]